MPVTPASRAAPRLLLVAAALLFSTGGAAIKFTTVTPWQTAAMRSGIAALALLLAFPDARRGWSWRILPPAMAYASCLLLFVHANKLTTAANTVFLQAVAPGWLLLLSPLLLKEPITRRDVSFVAALGAGMAMFFVGTQQRLVTAPDPARGNWLALLSGLAWALTLVGLRWQARAGAAGGALSTVVAGNLLTCLTGLPAALPVVSMPAFDLALLLYLGLIQIGLAYWCLTRGIRHVPAFESSAILLLEPVANPMWAWALNGERPGAWSVAGGVVIVVSTLVNIRGARK
jgi:DME family drug/metabolite transporter